MLSQVNPKVAEPGGIPPIHRRCFAVPGSKGNATMLVRMWKGQIPPFSASNDDAKPPDVVELRPSRLMHMDLPPPSSSRVVWFR